MKRIHILVRDSFHTATIADRLSAFYNNRKKGVAVVCHKSSRPSRRIRVHIFVLSARDVLELTEYVQKLKTDAGKPDSKVLVVSALDSYLDMVRKNPRLGADFTLPKGNFLEVGESRLDDADAAEVLDSLLESVL